MKVSEVQFQFSALTTQTEAQVRHWLEMVSPTSVVTFDIIDRKGKVGMTCIAIDEAGNLIVPKFCPDPRDMIGGGTLQRTIQLPDDIKFPKVS